MGLYLYLSLGVSYCKYKCIDYLLYYLDVGKLQNNKINYYSGSKKYSMIVSKKRKRGPTNILEVYKDKNINFTTEFLEYLGPHNNFNSIETTPEMLSCNCIEIHYKDDSVKMFNGNDIIVV